MPRANDDVISEILNVICEVADPVKVILFGSAARDEADQESDFDFLVVVSDGTHRRRTAQKIHENLFGIGCAKDIVVVTESDVEDYKDSPALVIYPALKEGRVLYESAA
ncbi:MAG: nucleotidyltransferase domain-containing protein [bacterium]